MNKTLFILSSLLLSISANAAYICQGNEVRQHGSLKAEATLSFNLHCLNGPKCFLSGLEGYIIAGGDRYSDPETVYQGYFKIKSMINDTNYNPRKYKNAKVYRNVNAYKTSGAEQGMWGDLILSKPTRTNGADLEAHYVFKAGDHMGGTIHMSCVKVDPKRR